MTADPDSAPHRRGLAADDITRVRWLSGVACAPDGSAILVTEARVSAESGQSAADLLLVRRADGEVGRIPGPPPGSRAHAARWDPTGRRVAFLVSTAAHCQLWLWTVGSAAATALADADGPPSWSPDGRRLVFPVSGAGAHSWLVLLDVATGERLQLTAGISRDHHCLWSPDGRRIAFLSDRPDGGGSAADSLWCVDVETRRRRRLTDGIGLVDAPVWSPDGGRLAYIANHDAADAGVNRQVHIVDIETGDIRSLTEHLDVSIGVCVQSDDERGYGDAALRWPAGQPGVLATFPVGGTVVLAWLSTEAAGAQPVVVAAGRRVVLSFDVVPGAGEIAYVASDPSSPGELHVAAPDGSAEIRLTGRNDDWLAEVELATMTEGCAPGQPGTPYWTFQPPTVAPGSAPRALVVAIHGGPHWPCGWRFSFDYQRLAARGFVVAILNPRGSQGYGEAYSTVIQGDWAHHDYADLVSVVAALRRSVGADVRLALTGASYGGYLSTWALAQPELDIRAAVAENPVTDLRTYLAHAVKQRGGAEYARCEFGGRPDEIADDLSARSPLSQADAISAPLLLVHGELDDDCPVQESVQLYERLRALGRDVELERIPGEGHGMVLQGSLSHRRQRWQAIDTFLDRCLI